jgi:hypothetical protein
VTPHEFIRKWKRSKLKERSAAQEHFIDLCRMVGQRTPAEVDPDGVEFCFERGAKKTGGGEGWADVWRRGYFAWEYKGKRKDLEAAFTQLQRYAIALENPPLLVVCDFDTIEIHTNFTNTVAGIHRIHIDELDREENLEKLHALFNNTKYFLPGQTKTALTEQAAKRFATLAEILRARGADPERVAHFLNRVLFCLFAQHAGLLPDGVVVQVFESGLKSPTHAANMLRSLFSTMHKGGSFGPHVIEWFNGLFRSGEAIPLEPEDIGQLLSVARLDWRGIEPSIFGTLFERGLDPDKRSQIGAHYTDADSIKLLVEPVVMAPLRRAWETERAEIEKLLVRHNAARVPASATKARREAQRRFNAFLFKLAEFRVLDPACGSGNFLYIALQELKDLEHEATLQAEQLGLEPPLSGMHVGVQCLRGIESNMYAAELARVTVWIGEIQWMLRHGMQPSRNPILKPLETIECRDAVIDRDGGDPEWPHADAIIGNPPFLGNKRMLSELGEAYTRRLRLLFKDRLPGGVDLVTYWFERALDQIEAGRTQRAGLVATQAIRKGANRAVLDRIVSRLPIFEAWRDKPWINEGAAVRVSLIAFGHGGSGKRLDGERVEAIQPDLTAVTVDSINLTQARVLQENRRICFMGTSKVGAFDVPGDVARHWLRLPNPHGASNADVLKPWANGQDLTGRSSDTWIIDFGVDMPQKIAALYEAPFAHIQKHVKPVRAKQRRAAYRTRWWIHAEARPGLRTASTALSRFIATPRVAKHRFFVWLPSQVLADSRLFAICRDDDSTFGVLSSRFHGVWALAMGSRHGDGDEGGRPTYNAHACFETFPFPVCDGAVRAAVEVASQRLNELRENWLNPPAWIQCLAEIDQRFPPRLAPKIGHETDLKARTLTNLYNERPTWLEQAHRDLDAAVAKAYGWKDYAPTLSDGQILVRLLKLNLARAPDLFSGLRPALRVVGRGKGGRDSAAPSAAPRKRFSRVRAA